MGLTRLVFQEEEKYIKTNLEILLEKLDAGSLLVTDPPCGNSTPGQNPPIFETPTLHRYNQS